MDLVPPPFYFVFYISNLLSYIQNNFSYELARPIMGTIFLVINVIVKARQRGNYAANSPSPRALARVRGLFAA